MQTHTMPQIYRQLATGGRRQVAAAALLGASLATVAPACAWAQGGSAALKGQITQPPDLQKPFKKLGWRVRLQAQDQTGVWGQSATVVGANLSAPLRWAYVDAKSQARVTRAVIQTFGANAAPKTQADWHNPPGLIAQAPVASVPSASPTFVKPNFAQFTYPPREFGQYIVRIVPLNAQGELPAGLMPSDPVMITFKDLH